MEGLFETALAETDYHHFPGGRKKLRALVAEIASRGAAGLRVLDVGCGNGSLTFPIAALGCDVVGVDANEDSIAHCREKNRFANARFVVTRGGLEELDASFDLIVCSEVLEHLHAPDPLIAAMGRKLAAGGRIFITIPNGYGPREVGGRWESRLRSWLGPRSLGRLRRRLGMYTYEEKCGMHTSNPDQDHVQKFTRRDIVSRLRAAGLEVSGWTNSFVILSVFFSRDGASAIERLDDWAADHLPAAFASGWFIRCERLRASPSPALRAASPERGEAGPD